MKTILTLLLIGITLSFMQCTADDVADDQILITYPDSGNYGINILDTLATISGGNDFSLSAKIPENGDLTIRITKLDKGNWFIESSSVQYWNVFPYDAITQSQSFSSSVESKTSDLHLEFRSGKYLFEFFENEDSDPTFINIVDI